tara:strand:+ start:21131 stop:22231 length:1101 start_codon:yes stop_codon:yes gene_type:complete
MLNGWLIGVAFAIAAGFLLARPMAVHRRSTQVEHDRPNGQIYHLDPACAVALRSILARTRSSVKTLDRVPLRQRLQAMRSFLDTLFSDIPIASSCATVDAAGVSAEWVVAKGTNPDWRMLYIHGGAFCSGSPLSHRTLTNRLSEVTGCTVLAIDYRLFPEHRLMAAILDCRTAYDWLLAHSCEGRSAPAQRLYIAGDSAGGNLTLSLLQWLRDSGRRLPDAAVALSPITDAALLSASIHYNYKSDPVLRPLFSLLKPIPWPFYWFITLLATRMSTSNPLLSPLLGRLDGLPPTLVQVSDSEMLLDDARRYVNKATAAGFPASLQCWEGMPHVWQIFHPTLPSATRALDEIGRFCAQYPSLPRGAPD